MVSAIEKEDYDFENSKYRPLFSTPDLYPSIGATWMENHFKNPLENRVAKISTDTQHDTYLIDTTIKAKIPSETFRQEKVNHWKAEHNTVKQWAWIEGGLGALLAGGTAVAATNSAAPLVIVALGVTTVASLVFMALNISKTHDASRQIAGWSANPLEKIAEDRAAAYRNGFPYVLRNDLKLQVGVTSTSKILLPEEVTFLFERYFDQFSRKLLAQTPHTEQGKKEWLDSFTSCNPVSNKALMYAYGQVPEKYLRVSYDYEVLHKQLTDLRGEFDQLRSQRRVESDKVIKGINQNRSLALAPFVMALAYYKREAEKDRDQKLATTKDEDKIREIKREYDAAILKYEAYHLAATLPINALFDSQISAAKENLRTILAEIKRNEATSHAPYFNYAWGLVDFARRVKEQPQFVYQPQDFSPGQVFHIPQPSPAPVVNINFIQEARGQTPVNVETSQYADYLKFVQRQRQ